MTTGDDSRQDDENFDFGPFLQRYLAGDRRALETLPERERELALMLAPAFEEEHDTDSANGEQGAPPRPIDPIAVALGLVPGPDDVLSGNRLQTARQRARLDLRQLVELLQQRGWEVNASQVLAWHSGNTTLAPALIKAIAETLDAPVRTLIGAPPRHSATDVGDFLDDAIIESYLDDWAAEIGQDLTGVRERAQRTLASLNFRNRDDISRDDVLAILRALRRIDPGGTTN